MTRDRLATLLILAIVFFVLGATSSCKEDVAARAREAHAKSPQRLSVQTPAEYAEDTSAFVLLDNRTGREYLVVCRNHYSSACSVTLMPEVAK